MQREDRGEPRESVSVSPQSGIDLLRIGGIHIIIDPSWFFIFMLVAWSLSAGYFPERVPGESSLAYWATGTAASLLFFASILLHELAHSFVAMAKGIQIPSITLFIFGGVSRLSEEAKDPVSELQIAIVGPLASFVLGGLFLALTSTMDGSGTALLSGLVEYLAFINFALGIFNLFPGFPLDGGRVLRALWWWRTGSLPQATRVAAEMGKAFAVALMLLGAIQIFTGQLLSGLWLLFIGMFLRGTAERGYRDILLRHSIEGVPVERVMTRHVVSVPPELSLRRLIDDYFLTHGYRAYPVVDQGRPVGIVGLEHLRDVSRDELEGRSVASVMQPFQEAQRVSPKSSLQEALERLRSDPMGRLIVTEDERVKGILTRAGLERLLETRRALESY